MTSQTLNGNSPIDPSSWEREKRVRFSKLSDRSGGPVGAATADEVSPLWWVAEPLAVFIFFCDSESILST